MTTVFFIRMPFRPVCDTVDPLVCRWSALHGIPLIYNAISKLLLNFLLLILANIFIKLRMHSRQNIGKKHTPMSNLCQPMFGMSS